MKGPSAIGATGWWPTSPVAHICLLLADVGPLPKPENAILGRIKAMTKRSIFEEMMEGVAAMKAHREGKLTPRAYKIEPAKRIDVDSKLGGRPRQSSIQRRSKRRVLRSSEA